MTARIFNLAAGILASSVSCHQQPAKPRYERVVLVHGIFENGEAFNSLKKRLETHGIDCYVPKLKPASGHPGLDVLAEGLKNDINSKFGETQPFALVAFSMGGLVSRHYLQNLGGAERCQSFITISTPHNGTLAAYTLPTRGVKQMRPDSDFIRELRETEHKLGSIPIVSYRTPMDAIIVPASSSVWERAENKSHNVILHPLMLHTGAILDDIERRFTYPLTTNQTATK